MKKSKSPSTEKVLSNVPSKRMLQPHHRNKALKIRLSELMGVDILAIETAARDKKEQFLEAARNAEALGLRRDFDRKMYSTKEMRSKKRLAKQEE